MSIEQRCDIDRFDPSQPTTSGVDTLVIGCGNLLRGDDAAGPVLVRRMWQRGLPPRVHCADGGTGGMDVAFQMRRVPHVILVDACQSGSEPGTLFELPGDQVEQLPPVAGINLHAFRWDHAIAFAHWLLKEDYPERVTVFLIEGADFEFGEMLSPAVDEGIDRLVERLFHVISDQASESANVANGDEPRGTAGRTTLQLDLSADGYLRLGGDDAEHFFPDDTLLAMRRDGELILLPTRGAAAGGLILKRQNAQGDRSLLISEVFDFEIPTGRFTAHWDDAIGGLRVDLQHEPPGNE